MHNCYKIKASYVSLSSALFNSKTTFFRCDDQEEPQVIQKAQLDIRGGSRAEDSIFTISEKDQETPKIIDDFWFDSTKWNFISPIR